MASFRQENNYSPKHKLSTSENEWGLTDISRLLPPLEGVQAHVVHSLPQHKDNKMNVYLKKKKGKENSLFKNIKNYSGSYVLLVFFSLSMPHTVLIEFPVS